MRRAARLLEAEGALSVSEFKGDGGRWAYALRSPLPPGRLPEGVAARD
jgi:hypothetical protein